jgi:putative salt-induced outer membrane protein YdiY
MKKYAYMLAGLVLTITSASAEEASGAFSTSLALGYTLNQGNTDSTLATAGLLTEGKWQEREVRAGADYMLGRESGATTADNARGFVGFKELLKYDIYGTTDASVMYDKIADVDYRTILSVGLGYYFLRTDKANLSLDVGPAYVWEKVGGEKDDYLAVRVAELFDYAISETAKVFQGLEYIVEADDSDSYLLTAEFGAEAQLNARLSMRLSYKINYDSEPAEDKKKSDRQLIAALVMSL